MFYGTVGVALTNDNFKLHADRRLHLQHRGRCLYSKSDWHAGLAAGAGVEYGWTPNLSTKLEYLWVGAGAANTLYENMVRVGVNYRFGG